MDFRKDLISGLAVFLVAIPLCLGVAQASGAPPVAGLLSGIVGGVLVGALSGSPLSVAGPAAGLTTLVLAGLASLGHDYRAFLTATLLAGVFQLVFGWLRLGGINRLLPGSVIKGMLSAIGIILVMKQLPVLLGYVKDLHDPKAGLVGVGALVLLLAWEEWGQRRFPTIPGALVAVLAGLLANLGLDLAETHLVHIPNLSEGALVWPELAALSNPRVWVLGLTIAVVASLESLLSLEAITSLDPRSRRACPNRELLAQGAGNTLAGMIGAIPITSVIVRSSVNLAAGATSRRSAIFHGLYLLLTLALLGDLVNLVPMSALAAVLVRVGWKMAAPATLLRLWPHGASQWLPYAVTVSMVLASDLLLGIVSGLAVAAGFVLHRLYHSRGFELERSGKLTRVVFHPEVTFLHKAWLSQALEEVQPHSQVQLDGRRARAVDPDVLETIAGFCRQAASRNIQVVLKGITV